MRALALLSLTVIACADVPPTGPGAPELGRGSGGITVTAVGPTKDGSTAEDVNDDGQVAGYTGRLFFTPFRAFVWRPTQPRGTSGSRQELGTLGGTSSMAKAIDNAGHVVGSSDDAAGTGRAFLWSQSGGMQDLGLAPGWTSAAAWDVNEVGSVVGIAETGSGQRAVFWSTDIDPEGIVHVLAREELGTLPGGGSSVAFAVNGSNQVVGYAYASPTGPNRAVMWTRTSTGWTIEPLGELPGDFASTAQGIDDAGRVVGYSARQQCTRAVLWNTQGGAATSVQALESFGGCNSEAWAINNQAQVVGRLTASGRSEATLWNVAQDGATISVVNLGRLSGTSSSLALGVSSNIGGTVQVAGLSKPTSGDPRATLWTIR